MIEYTIIVSYKSSKLYYTSPRAMRYNVWYDYISPKSNKK